MALSQRKQTVLMQPAQGTSAPASVSQRCGLQQTGGHKQATYGVCQVAEYCRSPVRLQLFVCLLQLRSKLCVGMLELPLHTNMLSMQQNSARAI